MYRRRAALLVCAFLASCGGESEPNGVDVGAVVVTPTSVALAPLIYASGQGRAREINVQTGAHRTFDLPAAQATALAVSGDRLFIGAESGKVGVVALSTGVISEFDVPGCGVYDVVVTPDGHNLLVTCSMYGVVKILDAPTLITVATIVTDGIPRRAAITPDGTTAVVANEAGWYDHIQ